VVSATLLYVEDILSGGIVDATKDELFVTTLYLYSHTAKYNGTEILPNSSYFYVIAPKVPLQPHFCIILDIDELAFVMNMHEIYSAGRQVTNDQPFVHS